MYLNGIELKLNKELLLVSFQENLTKKGGKKSY